MILSDDSIYIAKRLKTILLLTEWSNGFAAMFL